MKFEFWCLLKITWAGGMLYTLKFQNHGANLITMYSKFMVQAITMTLGFRTKCFFYTFALLLGSFEENHVILCPP
jgi:hypothetical protein